jgi:hypothetical protein
MIHFLNILFIFLSSFLAESSSRCYQILREQGEIAVHFEDNFLQKISRSRPVDQANINYPMLDYIVDQVHRSPRFTIKEHARETFYNSIPSHEEDIGSAAVRMAYSKTQYLGYDREKFFVFYRQQFPLMLWCHI